ncbi:MAG: primosomal protein [Caulobacteraceae bacterium]
MSDIPENAGDEQDVAEIFDETNETPDGVRIAHPDTDPPVFDATRADGDTDDLVAGDDETFDPDTASDEDLDMLLEAGERANEPRSFNRDATGADHVSTDEVSPADLEADVLADDDIAALGYDDGDRDDLAGPDREMRPIPE